jgi:hypothetical protein
MSTTAPAAAQVPAAQLPRECLVVWLAGWTFVVQLRLGRHVLAQHWCKSLEELVTFITDTELKYLASKQTIPTYLLHTATQLHELLSYEQARQLTLTQE